MTNHFIGIYEDKISPKNMPEIHLPSRLAARKILAYAKDKGLFTTFAETSWRQHDALCETGEEFFKEVRENKLTNIL